MVQMKRNDDLQAVAEGDSPQKGKKLIFFDVDGTLLPFEGQMPESAKYALRRAKAEGHQLFLCSGRSECSIAEQLLELGIDGIVSASGASIRYHGDRLRTLTMGEKIHKLLRVLEDCRAVYTIQSAARSTTPKRTLPWLKEKDLEEFHMVFEEVYADPGKYCDTEKAVVYYSPVPNPELAKRLAPEFEITASSFDISNQNSCEITMAGINKASAMQYLGEYLKIPREQMIAFGDGPNDLDMLAYAGTGIAMGNAVPEAKAVADHITGSAGSDGIYQAMKTILNWQDCGQGEKI